MATSSEVTTGLQATAAQYNNLRTDALENKEYVELMATAHYVTSATTWEDWDVSALVPAGTTEMEVVIATQNSAAHGIRENGSALVRSFNLYVSTSPFSIWVQLDANRVCECYASHNTTAFVAVGYLVRQ